MVVMAWKLKKIVILTIIVSSSLYPCLRPKEVMEGGGNLSPLGMMEIRLMDPVIGSR